MYAQRESTVKVIKRAVDSLFIMACHGNMIQYDLEPKPAAGRNIASNEKASSVCFSPSSIRR